MSYDGKLNIGDLAEVINTDGDVPAQYIGAIVNVMVAETVRTVICEDGTKKSGPCVIVQHNGKRHAVPRWNLRKIEPPGDLDYVESLIGNTRRDRSPGK